MNAYLRAADISNETGRPPFRCLKAAMDLPRHTYRIPYSGVRHTCDGVLVHIDRTQFAMSRTDRGWTNERGKLPTPVDESLSRKLVTADTCQKRTLARQPVDPILVRSVSNQSHSVIRFPALAERPGKRSYRAIWHCSWPRRRMRPIARVINPMNCRNPSKKQPGKSG